MKNMSFLDKTGVSFLISLIKEKFSKVETDFNEKLISTKPTSTLVNLKVSNWTDDLKQTLIIEGVSANEGHRSFTLSLYLKVEKNMKMLELKL